MTDDRLIQRLEEQLRDAHATNADLREKLNEKLKLESMAAVYHSETGQLREQLERNCVKLKAAQQNAVGAERRVKAAEREVRDIGERFAKLEAERDAIREEARELAELNAKVETAKGVSDLFS
jgi:chromosome segregation ATPase